jgi:cephalosporin hydroxylase
MTNTRDLATLTREWLEEAVRRKYAHAFTWLGRPILQVPQDVYAIQEIVWAVRPDLVIETGIAHGGSLVLSASLLALLDYTDALAGPGTLDPRRSERRVLGVDVEIRPHNRAAIESHPLAHLIDTIEGSSTLPEVVERVREAARGRQRVLVMLDSNHTHDHVLAELEAYAPLTSMGSYCVVWDTGVDALPDALLADRPWGKGNSPRSALEEYRRRIRAEGRRGADGQPLAFEIDTAITDKIAITASPDGFLRRVPAG